MGLKRTAQDIIVGTQLGPVTVEITAERVHAYAAAVQDTTPWYSNAFAVSIAPLAFIAILYACSWLHASNKVHRAGYAPTQRRGPAVLGAGHYGAVRVGLMFWLSRNRLVGSY